MLRVPVNWVSHEIGKHNLFGYERRDDAQIHWLMFSQFTCRRTTHSTDHLNAKISSITPTPTTGTPLSSRKRFVSI